MGAVCGPAHFIPNIQGAITPQGHSYSGREYKVSGEKAKSSVIVIFVNAPSLYTWLDRLSWNPLAKKQKSQVKLQNDCNHCKCFQPLYLIGQAVLTSIGQECKVSTEKAQMIVIFVKLPASVFDWAGCCNLCECSQPLYLIGQAILKSIGQNKKCQVKLQNDCNHCKCSQPLYLIGLAVLTSIGQEYKGSSERAQMIVIFVKLPATSQGHNYYG